jgi:hypothetical protein
VLYIIVRTLSILFIKGLIIVSHRFKNLPYLTIVPWLIMQLSKLMCGYQTNVLVTYRISCSAKVE